MTSSRHCKCSCCNLPLERFLIWLRNWRHWKTGRAYRDLTRAMQRDADFAHTWQCNIAMPILDGAKGKLTSEEANEIANTLMHHLFSVRLPKPEAQSPSNPAA